ncbi:hypothetical protein U9S86_004548 [Salmonella enterica]|nr:hypothetical protein [Salmonella enterica]EHA9546163.1 hypothetical protein [Salmonella enterica subsp. enterica serovar Braenderup]EHP7123077.1 hypothetical protein [Salmonella enterica subsp. enterica serovar Thompson]EBH4941545.1 hypothetical protein [Salmonella enterica]ECK3278469.1 hypothetical protein [Salmonella enterica]
MSPLNIGEHDKNLIWPDDLDEPGQSYQKLANLHDSDGAEHEVILEDDGSDMARVYLRHIESDEVSANFLLEFNLTAPEGFPERLPQVTSAFVGEEYRRVKLSQHVYRMLMKHYGAVVSDSHQTAGGMLIWLLMGEDDTVQLNIMQVRGDRLVYRLVDGEPETYTGEIEALEQAGPTIWGDPNAVISLRTLQRLGFRPAHQDMSHIVLAARAI